VNGRQAFFAGDLAFARRPQDLRTIPADRVLISLDGRIPRAGRVKTGLEKLGFPWILSSESNLFNGLRGIFAERNLSRAFARGGGSVGGMSERSRRMGGQDCS
jgi:hypothetical protein